MKNWKLLMYRHAILSILVYCCFSISAQNTFAQTGEPVFVDQGVNWNSTDRQQFYVTDQGSRIMPLAWMKALSQPDGSAFLSDKLARYGYLPFVRADGENVPIGFTVAPDNQGRPIVGMTCAACHTRQIIVENIEYRIDGGPAIVDFQSFLADLDIAVQTVLSSNTNFEAFSNRVLGSNVNNSDLRRDVEIWYNRYHALIDGSLPNPAWGPARLDAISMIFNRLTGLDIGKNASDIIKENIHRASAPTRYPFLWNAARQDQTQWLGFAKNGNDTLGLARNLGEVYGVFADFHPEKRITLLRLNRKYIDHNSANFDGLKLLEDLVWKIGKPTWQWGLNQSLVDQGKTIFERETRDGGCTQCHGIREGKQRISIKKRPKTWDTPIYDVGTDSHQCSILERTAKTGIMEGAKIPILGDELGAQERAFKVLSMTVVGAILQNTVRSLKPKLLDGKILGISLDDLNLRQITRDKLKKLSPELEDLEKLYQRTDAPGTSLVDQNAPPWVPSDCPYEARVLEGIWAAAPYLHNGSVASLADLLRPASERARSFQIGPNYDIENVGLAKSQSKFDYELKTTGCDDINSGNSRCGHEYGTNLPEPEKKALLEYLKSL